MIKYVITMDYMNSERLELPFLHFSETLTSESEDESIRT
jgi:hypothetical protein